MIKQRIVYPLGDGIVVVTPLACGLTVEQIAAKDVPAGTPYLIVDVADIPADRAYRAAWQADFSQPDGYGLTDEEWATLIAPVEPPVEPTPIVEGGTDRPFPELPS